MQIHLIINTRVHTFTHTSTHSPHRLYRCGVDFNPVALSSSTQQQHYPVDYSVPSFSSLVKWDHSIDWDVPSYEDFNAGSSSEVFTFDMSSDSEDAYLQGHCIDGRLLFPATGYLVLAWKTLAKLHSQVYDQLAVTFTNVHIHRATVLPPSGEVKLEVSLTPSTGHFEVSESSALVASGTITASDETQLNSFFDQLPPPPASDKARLDSQDVYKDLRLRGYEYKGIFQGVSTVDETGWFTACLLVLTF